MPSESSDFMPSESSDFPTSSRGKRSLDRALHLPEDKRRVEIKFFFGEHLDEHDVEAMSDSLDWCTVYVPEYIGWKNSWRKRVQDISDGNESPPDYFEMFGGDPLLSQARFPQFMSALYDKLAETDKIIVPLDVPQRKALFRVMADSVRSLENSGDKIKKENLSLASAAESFARVTKRFAEANIRREHYIVRMLGPAVKKILDEQKASGQVKDPIRILIHLGAAHTRVFEMVKAIHHATDAQFQEGKNVKTHFDELLINYLHKRPTPADVLPKALLTQLYFSALLTEFDSGKNKADRSYAIREYMENLTPVEQEVLFLAFKQASSPEAFEKASVKLIKRFKR